MRTGLRLYERKSLFRNELTSFRAKFQIALKNSTAQNWRSEVRKGGCRPVGRGRGTEQRLDRCNVAFRDYPDMAAAGLDFGPWSLRRCHNSRCGWSQSQVERASVHGKRFQQVRAETRNAQGGSRRKNPPEHCHQIGRRKQFDCRSSFQNSPQCKEQDSETRCAKQRKTKKPLNSAAITSQR
jgi:hypothetical protein